jgi:hypothetical protein
MVPHCVLDVRNHVYIHRQKESTKKVGKRLSDQWFSLPRSIAQHVLSVVYVDMKPICLSEERREGRSGGGGVSYWKPLNSSALFEYMIFDAIEKYTRLENYKRSKRATSGENSLRSKMNGQQYANPGAVVAAGTTTNTKLIPPPTTATATIATTTTTTTTTATMSSITKMSIIDLKLPRVLSRYIDKTESKLYRGSKHSMKEALLKCKRELDFVSKKHCTDFMLGMDEDKFI